MARICNNCFHFRKEYDEFRQQYVDMIVVDNTEPEQHFCPMYDDHIPNEIYYADHDCEFFLEKVVE